MKLTDRDRLRAMHRRAQRAEGRVQRASAMLAHLDAYLRRNKDGIGRRILALEFLGMVNRELEHGSTDAGRRALSEQKE